MKKLRQKKERERILGLLNGVEGRAFLARGVAKMYGRQAAEKRRIGKILKVECQIFLSKEIVLGHPCIPRVRVDTGSDKRPGMRKKGGAGGEGRGGRGGGDIYEAQRVKGKLHVITCDLASAAAHHLVSTNPRVRITVSKSPFFSSKYWKVYILSYHLVPL